MLFDQGEGFDAVFPLPDKMNIWKTLKKKGQFIPRGFFVIDDERVDGHKRSQLRKESICDGFVAFNTYDASAARQHLGGDFFIWGRRVRRQDARRYGDSLEA